MEWVFWVPQMCKLWQLTLPDTWNVHSSLKINFDVSVSCSWTLIRNEKCNLRELTLATIAFIQRCFCRIHHTVDCEIPYSWLPLVVNFLQLFKSLSRTQFTMSADWPGWPLRFLSHRHSDSLNFRYHRWIVLSVGPCFQYLWRKAHWIDPTDSDFAISNTQKAFCSPVNAIFLYYNWLQWYMSLPSTSNCLK